MINLIATYNHSPSLVRANALSTPQSHIRTTIKSKRYHLLYTLGERPSCVCILLCMYFDQKPGARVYAACSIVVVEGKREWGYLTIVNHLPRYIKRNPPPPPGGRLSNLMPSLRSTSTPPPQGTCISISILKIPNPINSTPRPPPKPPIPYLNISISEPI